MNRYLLFSAIILIAIVAAVVFFATAPRRDADGLAEDNSLAIAREQLDLHRTALTAMDNLETTKAATAWQPLAEANPTDDAILLNRGLTAVLHLDELATQAGDASASTQVKQAARSQLPAIITDARRFVDAYESNGGDDNIVVWMRSRIDLREAGLLPASMTRSIRREVFERLVQKIDEIKPDAAPEQESQILIAGQLTSVLETMEDPINGLPEDIVQSAATAMTQLSKLRPGNLFLALRAAQLAIAARSKQASELIDRTRSLTRSIEPTLARQTQPIGKTPDELIDEMITAVEEGRFDDAESQIRLWFNLLNSTDLIKTDRRRATPHPLDMVSFESLQAVANKVSQSEPLKELLSPIRFQTDILDTDDTSSTEAPVAMVAIDADLDFDVDLVTLGSDGEVFSLVLWLNDGGWKTASELPLPGDWAGMIVADLFVVDSSSPGRIRASTASNQHNTIRSVIVYGPAGLAVIDVNAQKSHSGDSLIIATAETGLESVGEVVAMATGDLEGDGDLDLIVATPAGLTIFVNRGNRTFFAVPESIVRAKNWDDGDAPVAMAITDLDRDLDLDIVTIHGASGRVGWIENLLHLQFRFDYLRDISPVTGADSIAVEDFDGNVSWDLLVSSPLGGSVVRTRTTEAGVWNVVGEESFTWHVGESSPKSNSMEPNQTPEKFVGRTRVADFDNDGFFEAVRSLASDNSQSGNDVAMIQIGTTSVSQQNINVAGGIVSSSVVSDFNNDRKIDLAGFSLNQPSRQPPAVAINDTLNDAKAVVVRFKGIDDNNVNSGRVNHYAIGSVLELRFGPHYRSRLVTDPVTHFGIDGIDDQISLRVIFPNGLTQTVPKVNAGVLVEEEQTLKGSCPYLFTYNGERFEFVTDCLWAAPLGLQVSPGRVVPDRPWEHLKIDGKHLAARDGTYDIRITEELWEVAYFDELKLTAVDHAEDVVVFTNEKVGPAQIAMPKIHAFARDDLKPASVAVATNGDDVAELLSEIDGRHVQGFDQRLRQGLCPPHWIDLDLSDRIESVLVDGKLPDDIEVKLVLTGWILPTDTSLNIQIDQNPLLPSPQAPSLWVPHGGQSSASTIDGKTEVVSRIDSKEDSLDEQREFKMVDPYIGFPGGKNKSMVVDVTPHLNPADPRIRIRTSQQIYWDQAAISVRHREDGERIESSIRVTPLSLRDAEVRWHGFSRRIHPGPKQAEIYDYADTSDAPRWPPLRDEFTNNGPVSDLLTEWDDRMVVIGGGDEIRLRFDATQKQPGMKRDFVLYGVGWDKDADLNTLAGQSTMPLPSRSMKSYPPMVDSIKQSNATYRANRSHLKRRQPFREFWSPPGMNPTAPF